MTPSDINALIISSIIGLVLIIFAIILLAGKGGSLIAGYNTMSEIEKAQYDEPALSKFIGKILLPIGILCPGMAFASIFEIQWLVVLLIVVTVGLVLFAVIYSNTNKRFRRK